jgi:uncharacterized membrane protein
VDDPRRGQEVNRRELLGSVTQFYHWELGGGVVRPRCLLVTGIVAMLFSVPVALWSVRLIRGKGGATGFLLLFIALTLTGGGIGYIIFFVPVWAYATRLKKPLVRWRKVLHAGVRRALSRIWIIPIAAASLFLLIGLEISVFGFMFPGRPTRTSFWVSAGAFSLPPSSC